MIGPEETLIIVLSSLGLSGTEVWKTARGSSPRITSTQLLEAILTSINTPDAAKVLNIGEQTINRLLKQYLVPLLGSATGGNNTWKLKLLSNAELKVCYVCHRCLYHSYFTIGNNTYDKLCGKCKDCISIVNSAFYSENKDTYHKKYLAEHIHEYRARNAKRRADVLQATPTWANISRIQEIYKSCPVGYHVDHIIPLINPLVCGLHVEYNLRIIPAKENLQKGNKFNICGCGEIGKHITLKQ